MENNIFKADKISFSYSKNKVIKDMTFSISKGKITTVIGANGCGKSTLFGIMAKTLKVDSGKLYFENKNINQIKLKDFAKKVAIVNQYNTSPDDVTVEKLVSYGRTPHKNILSISSSKEDDEKVDWAIKITNLESYRNSLVNQLSGGQKQRVWIAMALAQDTNILLLDEPTTYLDIKYQLEILNLIKELNQKYKITIVLVLHDLNQSLYYSDEILAMKEGEIINFGKPVDIINRDLIKNVFDIDLQVETLNGKPFVLTVDNNSDRIDQN